MLHPRHWIALLQFVQNVQRRLVEILGENGLKRLPVLAPGLIEITYDNVDIYEHSLSTIKLMPQLGMGRRTALELRIWPPILKRHSIPAIDNDDDEGTLFQGPQAGRIGGHSIDMREATFIAHQRREAELLQPSPDRSAKVAQIVAGGTDKYLEGVTHLINPISHLVLIAELSGYSNDTVARTAGLIEGPPSGDKSTSWEVGFGSK